MRTQTVIIAHHGLGDLLMTWPLIQESIRTITPGHSLTLFVRSSIEADFLEELLEEFEESITIEVFRRKSVTDLLKSVMALRRLRPTRLMLPHMTQSAVNVLLAIGVGARKTAGPHGRWSHWGYQDEIKPKIGEHKAQYYYRFSRLNAGQPSYADILLPLPQDRLDAAGETLQRLGSGGKWILFAPGSGEVEAHKRWPIEHFAALADRLMQADESLQIGLFGSPVEEDLLSTLQTEITKLGHKSNMIMGQDVMEGLALMAQTDCVVTGCSGASHMAAATGVPIVGLYGPTNPGYTGPFSDQVRMVRFGLACSPCYRPGFISGCGTPICMKLITPGQVFDQVIGVLEKTPNLSPSQYFETTNAVEPAPPSEEEMPKMQSTTSSTAQRSVK